MEGIGGLDYNFVMMDFVFYYSIWQVDGLVSGFKK